MGTVDTFACYANDHSGKLKHGHIDTTSGYGKQEAMRIILTKYLALSFQLSGIITMHLLKKSATCHESDNKLVINYRSEEAPSNLVIHMGLKPFKDLFILLAGKFMVCVCKIQLFCDMPVKPEPLRQGFRLFCRLLPWRAPPIILQKTLLI